MKIVWGNPEEVTLFPYILEGLAARGRPCQKNTLIVLLSRLMKKGFLHAKKTGRRNEYTVLISEVRGWSRGRGWCGNGLDGGLLNRPVGGPQADRLFPPVHCPAQGGLLRAGVSIYRPA